jgi:hypothetical protein
MARLDGLEEELLQIGSAYSRNWTYALTDIQIAEELIAYKWI